MREQDEAAGYSSIALPYGVGAPGDKFEEALVVAESLVTRRIGSETRRQMPGERLGLAPELYDEACWAAFANGTDAATELVAAGDIGEEEMADAIADALGLLRERIDPSDISFEIGRPSARILRTIAPDLRPKVFIAPRLEDLDRARAFFAAAPALRGTARVTTLSDIAEARERVGRESRSQAARLSLSRDVPHFSARQTFCGLHGFVGGILLVCLVAGMLFMPAMPLIVHIAALPLYFGCIALRFGAAFGLPRSGHRQAVRPVSRGGSIVPPRYSLLVALREEKKDCVEALVEALAALRWPASRLEILLVCETDDRDTVRVCRDAIAGYGTFKVVEVPPSFPRTKPKALNFALPLATGEFVALYDAEDRPRPDQLMAAFAAFEEGPAELACVQAPLLVTNGARHWLAAHFAIEYSALFSGFLPWLASRGMPLPLGGTSNHFRRDALVAVGAWDSHNVAEDADLGIRLARHGYRTGTIASPTFEEAPERWIDWRNQRTRWMKGWLQTWLVHMRQPRVTFAELGGRNFLVFQLLFAGMIASSLAHTFVLALVLQNAAALATEGWPSGIRGWLLAVDLLGLVVGYGVYAKLALACHTDKAMTLRHLWTLPAYWTLVGAATVRAVWQLFTAPQLWEKTPHGKDARRHRAEDRMRNDPSLVTAQH